MEKPPFLTASSLRTVRQNIDLVGLWNFLQIQKDDAKSKEFDWWACSPLTDEKTPSFHMDMHSGRWFCFSSNEGGGPIELLRLVLAQQGQHLNSYEVGKWLLRNHLSSLSAAPSSNSIASHSQQSPTLPSNTPTKHDLTPLLKYHQAFEERGISKDTCKYLGIGYLPPSDMNQNSPMRGRLVFQIRGISQSGTHITLTTLTHIGRALGHEEPKWRHYGDFHKSAELYNIDKVLTDEQALHQAQKSKRIYIVEGCFDVAKMIEAGIKNVVAVFGSRILEHQLPRLRLIQQLIPGITFVLWLDRDQAGKTGTKKSLALLEQSALPCSSFPWEEKFTPSRIPIPSELNDVCDFSTRQLVWFSEYLLF